MQGLFRNKRRCWYALYTGQDEEIVTEDGLLTGHYRPIYGNPVEVWVNASTTSGITNNNIAGRVERYDFGIVLDYQYTINPIPDNCPIDEMSVFWMDTVPEIKADGSTDTPFDHIVTRISSAVNHRACQIAKVVRSDGVIV